MRKGREVWTDATGKKWKVREMSDSHVRNAFCFLLRKLDERPFLAWDECDVTIEDTF